MTQLHSTRGSKTTGPNKEFKSRRSLPLHSNCRNLIQPFLLLAVGGDEPQSWVAQTMECQPDVVISEEELVALQRLEFAACEKS